jgi:hypothetical protein
MEACKRGVKDIVALLLAVPGVDVHAAQVSCVSGKRCTMGSVTGTFARCEREVCRTAGCGAGRSWRLIA